VRSVVLTANGKMESVEVSQSALPPDHCRVVIHSAGICSSDVPRAFDGGAYRYPLVLGHELAGVIETVGDGTDGHLRAGDRVTVFPLLPCFECVACRAGSYSRCSRYDYYGSRCDGGFTERLDVRSWNLLKVPDGVSLDDASLTEPTAVVIHALGRLGFLDSRPPPSDLLILGGGFLGLLAVRLMAVAHAGLPVTVVDRNAWKLEMAAADGASTAAVPDDASWDAFLAKREGTAAAVLEAVGAPTTFAAALRLAGQGGAVVWMGNLSGELVLPAAEVSQVLRKELSVRGTWNSGYDGDRPSDWTNALQWMASGLRPSELVSLRVDLDGLPDALRRLHDHKQRVATEHLIKVVVHPNPSALGHAA